MHKLDHMKNNKKIEENSNGVKKIIFLGLSAFVLAGCTGTTNPEERSVTDASILRSEDSGVTFEPKVWVDEKTSLTGIDVLSWEFHPTNPNIIYIGTLKNGMYRSTDRGEAWEKMYFPPIKAYGLAVDPSNGDRLYASGVYGNVSKLYSSQDAGNEWKEIYTEPGAGSVMTALAVDPHNTNHILAANSNGVVIESLDRGTSWKNVNTFSGPVTQVTFMQKAPGTVLVLIQGKDIVVSRDNGATWPTKEFGILPVEEFEQNFQETDSSSVVPTEQNTIVVDQYVPGLLYTGTNQGLYRSRDYGVSWEAVNILESSKEFPIRAVAVNPKNSQEIVYTAGSALYRTQDNGNTWSTTKLDITRPVRVIQFDPTTPSTIYIALKKQ